MWEILNVLRRLHRGKPHASIARATSYGRSTIRRYARAAAACVFRSKLITRFAPS